jgi:hypothetical protein
MKRTIVKFGAATLLMGMFLLMPSCKSEAPAEGEDTTEAVAEEATQEDASAESDCDTCGGKDIKPVPDPPKAPAPAQ